MAIVITPNMALPVPSVGLEPGPQYATDVNTCLNIVDAHDHTPGSGTLITPSAISINADLTFNSQNAIALRSVRLDPQGAALAQPTDLGCIYEAGVDLYFNDGNGNQIRLTQAGSIVGASGNITNLLSPASVVYVGASSTFIFQSNTLTAAHLDAGSLILRNLTPSSPGLTLAPPTLSVDYTIVLPVLPAANLPVSINASGIMSATPVTFIQLASTLQARIATVPTVQLFLSGSGTYTTPTSPAPLYIRVTAVGGGGGGGNNGNSGTSGTATTFGSSLIIAGGGSGGGSTGLGGDGGTPTINVPAIPVVSVEGGWGGGASNNAATAFFSGGQGGSSALGGAGRAAALAAGTAGKANTGGGGGGGGNNNIAPQAAGGGGGAGAYIIATIGSPSATYSYSVGVGGTPGTGADAPGGNGGSGLIVVEEFYC